MKWSARGLETTCLFRILEPVSVKVTGGIYLRKEISPYVSDANMAYNKMLDVFLMYKLKQQQNFIQKKICHSNNRPCNINTYR